MKEGKKSVLITGAASGFGARLTLAFARAGYFMVDIHPDFYH